MVLLNIGHEIYIITMEICNKKKETEKTIGLNCHIIVLVVDISMYIYGYLIDKIY